MIRLIRLVILALGLTTAAVAQPIPGAEAPGFVGARALWLAGDDLPALQALAGLAREGNTAAQMLLSQIATATWTHAHVTEGMNRRDRIALLRQEGGLSGRDWMQAAAEADAGAAILWALRRNATDEMSVASVLQSLLPRGERRAAYDFLLHRVETGQVQRLSEETFDYLRWFGGAGGHLAATILAEEHRLQLQIWIPNDVRTERQFYGYLADLSTRQSQIEAEGSGPLFMVRNRMTFGSRDTTFSGEPSVLAMRGQPGNAAMLRDAISASTDLQPLIFACEALCPSAGAACLVSATEHLTHPGSAFPYPFASPSPALIRDAGYQQSPRFMRDLRARLEAARWPGCEG